MGKGKEGVIIVEGEEQAGVRPRRDQGCQGCSRRLSWGECSSSFFSSLIQKERVAYWPVLNVSHKVAGRKPWVRVS